VATKAAIGEAVALTHLQGVHSSVNDLVLRGGENLVLKAGAAIVPTPRLTRTMGGASSIVIPFFDPERQLLQRSLLAEAWTAEIDGLLFRYPGALSKQGKTLTLTLEDRWIAKLREFHGPIKARRDEMTRAEFILMLVEEACPGLLFVCPQLHKVQPIATEGQAKRAKDEATQNRGRGLGAGHGLTIDGEKLTTTQLELADKACRIAESGGAPYICVVAVLEGLMAESTLGDASPGNVLQGLGPGGAPIGTAAEEIAGFLFGKPRWTGTSAVGYHQEHPDAPAHVIAQAVQASEFSDGSNYRKFEGEARAIADSFGGGEFSGEGFDATEPYTFEVGKKENYWTAIKRLAKEVNWRCFVLADRMIYMPETELLQGKVRLAIDGDEPWIESVDFSFDGASPVTQVTVECLIKQWSPPPGSVVTLAGYGPASVGFGDAPPQPNSKGEKIGLSGNRRANGGEGRGRYLVASIEVPLTRDPAERLATITLHKPTPPLPEPAAERKAGGSSRSAGGAGGMGVLEGTPEDIVNEVVDYAHSHGFPGVTRESVRAANAAHGPTVDGGTSDHQGPPNVRWAADMSNGYETPEEDALAAAIAEAFDIPWDGSGLVTHSSGGYRMQLIYRTYEGGNHYNHVHFGVEVA
jgi:hypothetical protein